MIAVVDYGMSNLLSVRNAFAAVGAEAAVTDRAEDLLRAERVVLPGVGAFGHCVENLRRSGLAEALEEAVLRHGKPFLGICLGMQVLAREGREGGTHRGLGWVAGVSRPFHVGEPHLRVPHVGWNDVTVVRDGAPIFKGLPRRPTFYFAHSFLLELDGPEAVATCEYGEQFAAALQRDNLFATQFHPEKSQAAGLRLLENFAAWRP